MRRAVEWKFALVGIVLPLLVAGTAFAERRDDDSDDTSLDLSAVNQVYASLTDQGISVGDDQFVTLPRSITGHDYDAASTLAAIAKLSTAGHKRDRFLRDSTVSPVYLKIYETEPDESAKSLYHVDVVFVAYGSLRTAVSDDFLLGLTAPTEQSGMSRNLMTGKFLSRRELSDRGLSLSCPEEHFVHSKFRMWERVSVSATSHVQVTRDDRSTLIAAQIDPRFVDDPDFPHPMARRASRRRRRAPLRRSAGLRMRGFLS